MPRLTSCPGCDDHICSKSKRGVKTPRFDLNRLSAPDIAHSGFSVYNSIIFRMTSTARSRDRAGRYSKRPCAL